MSAVTAFAGRVPAWNKVGTVVEEGTTLAQAFDLAGMRDWNVRKSPLQTVVLSEDGAHMIDVPGRYAVIRDTPTGPTAIPNAVVGERYTTVQNEESEEVLTALVDAGDLLVDTVGVLGEGNQTFTSVRFPEGIKVGGEDPIEVFLLARNSHDGTTAFTLAVTPVRTICQNTLTLALRQARRTYSIRHTTTIQGRIEQAREALKISFDYRDAFAEEMEHLLTVEVTRKEFTSIVDSLIPMPKGDREGWRDRAQQQRDDLAQLFNYAETCEYGRGTAYAAYNAVTEYADWFMPVKGVDPHGIKRAERSLTSSIVQKFKDTGTLRVLALA